jgi:hypothetical protein
MSDVIDLLERMGQDAQWSHVSQDDIELALALANAKVDPDLQFAILGNDQLRLEELLGVPPFCAMQFPGEEEEEDDSEEKPAPENEEKSAHSLSLDVTAEG